MYHMPDFVLICRNQPSALELERGTLGVDSLEQIRTTIDQNSVSDTQLLPSHLKCGMWASLALATVFVAGEKTCTTLGPLSVYHLKDLHKFVRLFFFFYYSFPRYWPRST